jgi:hypothetical protein
MNGDAVVACADLVGRAGATDFQIGWIHDDVPIEEAGWYAHAQYRGARITAADRKSPSEAALGLAERLLRGAACRCGKQVTLGDAGNGCRWRLSGKQWQPSCDVPSLKFDGPRGDLPAMNRAMRRAQAQAKESK